MRSSSVENSPTRKDEKTLIKHHFLSQLRRTTSGHPKFLGAQEIESAYDESSLRPAIEKQIPENSILKTDGKGIYRQFAMEKNCVHEQVIAMKDPELAHEHLNWINIVTSNLK